MELRATFLVARLFRAACCELPTLFFFFSRSFPRLPYWFTACIYVDYVLDSLPNEAAEGQQQQQQQQQKCVKLFDVLSLFPRVTVFALHIHICIHKAVSFFSAVYHGLFLKSQLAAVVTSLQYVSRWLSLNAEQRRVKCSSRRCAFLGTHTFVFLFPCLRLCK